MDMALVRTTVATEAQARDLAARLVEEGAAACVHRQQVQSCYRWEGKVCYETEWLVEARTLSEGAERARRLMLRTHPYQVPLVEVLPVTGVPEDYGRWARSVTVA